MALLQELELLREAPKAKLSKASDFYDYVKVASASNSEPRTKNDPKESFMVSMAKFPYDYFNIPSPWPGNVEYYSTAIKGGVKAVNAHAKKMNLDLGLDLDLSDPYTFDETIKKTNIKKIKTFGSGKARKAGAGGSFYADTGYPDFLWFVLDFDSVNLLFRK